MTSPNPSSGSLPSAPSAPPVASSTDVPKDVESTLSTLVNQAPAVESVISGLPQATQLKAAALKLAAELHSGLGHLFQHHSLDDLIADAKKIEAYLAEDLPKV